MAGDRLRGKRRYLYRKKLLRRQAFLLNEFRVLYVEARTQVHDQGKLARWEGDLRRQARELAGRMVRHGLQDQCMLLDHLVEEVMEA